MRIDLTIKAIENLTYALENQSAEERIQNFVIIRNLADDLKKALALDDINDTNLNGKINETVNYARYSAGLDDNGHGLSTNAGWAIAAAGTLQRIVNSYRHT